MDSRIKELFERYQAGKASIDEIKLVEEWFAGYDNNKQQEILAQKEKGDRFSELDRDMLRLVPLHKNKTWLGNHWLQAAAALLVASGLILFEVLKKTDNLQPSVSYTLVSAPNGVKKDVALPDGTIISLNSGSNIRIPSDFGKKDRQLYLTGEAFFNVKHDPAKPLTIHLGKLLIQDIGTTFNVKAYPDERQIRVAVETGEVRIEETMDNGKTEMFASSMTRNQQLIYDRSNGSHILNRIKTDDITAWKRNQLRFDNASVGEIAHALERWYNVTVKFDSKTTDNRLYTVSFNNEPAADVLKVLSTLTEMKYQIDNGVIYVNLKHKKRFMN